MAGDVVARDVEEQQVVEAGEEVGGEEGERVVLEEQLLQVGALLEDGRGAGGMGVVGGTACPAYAFSLLSVVFGSCFDLLCVCICVCCDCYLLCICLKTGLG